MSPSTNETSAIVSVWSCPAVPTAVLPPNPSLIFDSFCQDRGTCPRALFFPSDYFPFNCQDALWSNCSHTPSNTQPGNASCTPSHLLQSTLQQHSTREMEGKGGRERQGVWVVSGKKKKKKSGLCCSVKTFPVLQ